MKKNISKKFDQDEEKILEEAALDIFKSKERMRNLILQNSNSRDNKLKSDNKNYFYDKISSDQIFYLVCKANENPCAYGSLNERRLILKYKCSKNTYQKRAKVQDKDCGDFNKNGKNYEAKISFATLDNPNLDYVQIRLHHDKIDFYIIQAIDFRNENNLIAHSFLLTHDQMKKEVELLRGGSAHGSESNAGFRIDFDITSEIFNRFVRNYSVSLDDHFKI